MVPINNIYYEDEWITNLQIYLSKYLFVLISFDSLLATGLLFILIEVLSKKSQKQ